MEIRKISVACPACGATHFIDENAYNVTEMPCLKCTLKTVASGEATNDR